MKGKDMGSTHCDRRAVYELQVEGTLDPGWEAWLNGLTITRTQSGEQPTTTLSGPLADQAALRGLLCRLWDLNLTLVSVRRVEADGKEEDQNE